MTVKKKALENAVGENACIIFSFFSTVFSTVPKRETIIFGTFNLLSVFAFRSKILFIGKELALLPHKPNF